MVRDDLMEESRSDRNVLSTAPPGASRLTLDRKASGREQETQGMYRAIMTGSHMMIDDGYLQIIEMDAVVRPIEAFAFDVRANRQPADYNGEAQDQ